MSEEIKTVNQLRRTLNLERFDVAGVPVFVYDEATGVEFAIKDVQKINTDEGPRVVIVVDGEQGE